MSTSLDFQQLVTLCQRTDEEIRSHAARAIDTHLVVRNFLFGLYIVQFEQEGADRAAYGTGLVDALTTRLKNLGIKGISPTRLRLYRNFYREYQLLSPIQPTLSVKLMAENQATSKSETPSRISETALTVQTLSCRFTLGWSHYVELLTIDSPDERRFYEIEATANQWSVRELHWQIDSSLYQRLALSRNKDVTF